MFGLLVYEVLVGKAAFPSDSPRLEEKIMKSEYHLPSELSAEARDLISRLVVGQPEKRLTISSIKKHGFFDKLNWDKARDGQLKMPKLSLRKIVKSDLPYNYNGDSEEDDYFEKPEGHESSIMERPEEGGDGMMGEDVPVMIEVHVNPTNPIDQIEAEERKLEVSAGGGFEFDDSKMGHIPHTYNG